jgi:hypothetical protein
MLDDWSKELFWIFVGGAIAGIAGTIGALINWFSQRHKTYSDNAWADYELRRDAYLDLVGGIDCLFEHSRNSDASAKKEWHQTARKVRIVGSDEVVLALNALTYAIKSGSKDSELRFHDLNLALRKDIRTIRRKPPEGTKLEATAFPIEK